MKLSYQNLNEERVIQSILESCTNEDSLISGAHQMLLDDGRIETFSAFAKITGELAHEVHKQIARSRLFIQINDQLGFEGMTTGNAPRQGRDFWEAPFKEMDLEGHIPAWPEDSWLEDGVGITGEKSRGLVSEWWLQRWHRQAGLSNRNRFSRRSVKNHIMNVIESEVPQAALMGTACRANGCAHEIMVEAPFCIERGYRQLIGFWPDACKGPVLFGTTLACYAMERNMKGPSGRKSEIHFNGPFRYVNVFINSQNPRTLKEALDGASIVTVETNPQAPLLQNEQGTNTP